MDLGLFSLSVCFVIVSLQGGAWSSNSDNPDCPCPQIPTKPLTVPPEQRCHQINDRFRYQCVEGFVRKAGTSNLSVCKNINGAAQWSASNLECIAHPLRPVPATTPPLRTKSTSPQTNNTSAPGSQQPTSPGVTTRSDGPEAEATDPVTEIRTKPDGTTTADPSRIPHTGTELGTKTTAGVVCVLLLAIVCALMGVGFVCYKRKLNDINPPHEPEEVMAMN